ncbi:MAG: ABC transporter substrate-binding protein, partial [Sphaerochaetaceae bacterium]
MKKLLIILLVAIVTLGCVFAQGAEETGTKEPTKLVVWSAAAEDETQALIHKFNESYPNIDVQMIAAGSNELKTKLMAEQPKPSGDVIMGIAKETA